MIFIRKRLTKMYYSYHTYGYNEPQAFETIAQQKDFKFAASGNVDVPVTDIPNFYNQNGQTKIDIAEVEL